MKKIATLLLLCQLACGSISAQCSPDTEAPVLSTVNGLSVNILPTKMTVLWATDFIQSVQDNCSAQNAIQASLRLCGTCTGFPLTPDGQTIDNISFTCADLGTQMVEVWVRDAAGNTAVDTVYVVVQDNGSICSGSGSPSLSCARTEQNVPVSDISWSVEGGNPALPPTIFYLLPNSTCFNSPWGISLDSNYTITPKRDNDHLNGVSTFDLVLINKHILGLEPLNSPYKRLAADANNSRSITTFDIVELRKLILGIYSELPNHTSWGFIPTSFVFPNPNNPFQTATPKSVKYNQALAGGGDFVGYKVGDVNGNASSCNYLVTPETRSAVPILTDDRLLQAGETARLAWRLPAGAPRPAGLQFSLYFDPEELDIAGLALGPGPGSGQPASADGFYAQPEPGILNFSWNAESGAAVATGDALIYLDVRARQAVPLGKAIRFDQSRLRAELYTGSGETQALSLAFLPAPAPGETQIFPATPNPSAGSVFIPVQLVQPAAVRIAVYDLSGRPVYVAENEQAAGFQRHEIPAAALAGLRGMLVYRVQVGQVISCGKIAI